MNRTARIMVLVAVAALAVVAFVVLRPESPSRGPGPTATSAPASPGTTAARPGAQPRLPPLIRVRGGSPVGGVRRIEASRGELVRFRVSSDTADEVHVHGYDLVRRVPAGRTVTVRFRARLEGIFEVELHGSHRQIAQLRVNP